MTVPAREAPAPLPPDAREGRRRPLPRTTYRRPVHVVPPAREVRRLPRPRPERVPERGRRRVWLLRLKWGVEAALAGAAGYAVYYQRHQIASAGHLLSEVRWDWLVVAIVFEASSMLVFARLQRWLLRSGGVDLGLAPMVEITLAGNAMSVTLPGGAAWAAAFAYEQLRRRGADRTLAGWVILVAGALSSFALFVIFAAGVEIAWDHGPVTSLRVVVLALAAIPVAAGGALVAVHRSQAARALAGRLMARAEAGLPRGPSIVGGFRHLVERIRTVQPSRRVWAVSMALAVTNWMCDCATLAACIEALGLRVPWTGLLVAYGLAQVSASLPITPGGVGVVEGSLTFFLVAYGMHSKAAVASALLYRIVSFWGLIPVGWSVWGYLELRQRQGARGDRHHPWAWHQQPDDEGTPEPGALAG
ncbi:MAG: lysylphosphatidylglycerol synthase transmembrane domain-containing protein [Acidimicrobiales bacterium]